jgi:hypothetical protein
MSGILSSKSRIFDTILTQEGRSQLSKGKLKAAYYSFSDLGMIYNEDTIISGGLDSTYRIMLEAGNLPQDQITFKADDSGKLVGFFGGTNSQNIVVLNGKIFDAEGNAMLSSQFNSLAGTILSNSIDAFKNQYILKSPDPIDNKSREFILDRSEIEFTTNDNKPLSKKEISTAKIDHIESFYQDKRLGHIPNFKFLPPVNRAKAGATERTQLGNYVNFNQAPIQNLEDLEKELSLFESKTVLFTETSNQNNVMCQFFEKADDSLKKLDVIDFGNFTEKKTGFTKHIFFVGKVFVDGFSQPTFVNMFTLIFENGTGT